MKIITSPDLSRWEECKKLRIEALENVPQAFLDDPVSAEKTPKEEWQRKMKGMYFAQIDGKWVGMVGFYQDEKKKLRHIMNVVGFYVQAEYRGKGVGRELLRRVVQNAKNQKEVTKLQLGVVTTQDSAYALYESVGFENVGKLKQAVKVEEKYFDEYLMEFVLV